MYWFDLEGYICGPLTDLPPELDPVQIKAFYSLLADRLGEATGRRPFVPHEHCDPIVHASLEPHEVDSIERGRIDTMTGYLIVLPLAPSWGGGIEVEMAYHADVPVFLLCDLEMLKARKISRLLRGNPGITQLATYTNLEDALQVAVKVLSDYAGAEHEAG